MKKRFTIGSLFDGSGGFPLAASMCGGEPVWASEIEPYPIAVTKSRFPQMAHWGDISKINGAEIEPVDVITFGSPCQDMSVAGKRAGLKHEDIGDEETTRSGLFMEAVRIAIEMRRATNGKYPKFMLWENVPGAFSSNKGEDFRIVLEELIKIVEPYAVMPPVPSGGWAYADCYVGDGWSLAYRVFDAQYWGVPQRRRRIHLILDLTGQRAGEILFELEGVRGYPETSRTPWQGAAADAERGAGAADCTGECISFQGKAGAAASLCIGVDVGASLVTAKELMVAYGIDHVITKGGNCTAQGTCVYEDIQATLKASGVHAVAYSFDSLASNSMKPKNPHSGIYEATPLVCEAVPHSAKCVGVLASSAANAEITDGKISPCLMARAGTDGNQLPLVSIAVPIHDQATDRHAVAYAVGNGQLNQISMAEVGNTLDCMHDQQAVCIKKTFQNTGQGWWNESPVGATVRTPCGGDATLANVCVERTLSQYIVRRLTPTECARLQGFPDDWGHPDHKESLTNDEYAFWMGVRNTHAAINGKQEKQYTREQMVKWYNGLHTDSAEYKMWGNGIALPPALYCMQGIAEALRQKQAEET